LIFTNYLKLTINYAFVTTLITLCTIWYIYYCKYSNFFY